jgi:hypothetical protein
MLLGINRAMLCLLQTAPGPLTEEERNFVDDLTRRSPLLLNLSEEQRLWDIYHRHWD